MALFRRYAFLAATGILVAGVSACNGDGNRAEDAPVAEFTVADTDLATESTCYQDGDSFVLQSQVRNDADHAASYIVTATVQSAKHREYRASKATDATTIQAGETGDVTLDNFGTDAPDDATCTITAIKKRSTD